MQYPHSQFKRFGDDLVMKVLVTIPQAIMGGHFIRFQHLDGRIIVAEIDPSEMEEWASIPGMLRQIGEEGMYCKPKSFF